MSNATDSTPDDDDRYYVHLIRREFTPELRLDTASKQASYFGLPDFLIEHLAQDWDPMVQLAHAQELAVLLAERKDGDDE